MPLVDIAVKANTRYCRHVKDKLGLVLIVAVFDLGSGDRKVNVYCCD